jgi:hypothetical protein
MLSPQADAGTEEPNRRSVSDLVLDGRRWRCGAGTSSHRGPFRQETGLSVLFEGCRQGYSPYETQVDGLPIWGMSVDGQTRWYRTGTSVNWGRLRQKTGLLVLFGVRRQSYSTYEMRAGGLPIWGMLAFESSSKAGTRAKAISY